MQKTKKKTISFRTDEAKCETLDKVALSIGEDRTYILNQAMNNILDIYAWQIEHIKQGVKEADAEKFIDEKQWRQSSKGKF